MNKVYYVDQWRGPIEDGSADTPFSDIHTALEVAGENDTIRLRTGDYQVGRITLTTPGLLLEADEGHRPVIYGMIVVLGRIKGIRGLIIGRDYSVSGEEEPLDYLPPPDNSNPVTFLEGGAL